MLVLLLTGAATVLLYLLPRWAPPPAVVTMTAIVPMRTAATPVPPLALPDDEQITAVARSAAQTLLRASLARVAHLQTLHVEHWHRTGLQRVQENIGAGEKAYREQRFRAAQDAYRAALTAAARVETRLPAVLAALLQAGDAALEQGHSAHAAAAFGQVLAIVPEDRRAALGRARAGTLDRVQALVEQAEAYAQMGAPDRARAAYVDAARLDPQATRVTAGLARLDHVAQVQRLRTALSEGHVALAHGDFNAAGLAFKRAAALDAQSLEVQQGQRDTERRAAAAAITAHLERAARAVRSEAWPEAARAYGAALALDSELDVAREGQRDAKQRAQLDTQLAALSQDVLALTEDNPRALAQRMLASAKTIAPAGPRLSGQLATLNTALRQAREALNVTLVSDGQSEVSVDGVGALGRFTEHTLQLAPGRYRAHGRHDGRADVRIEFTITPGATAPRITLQSAP